MAGDARYYRGGDDLKAQFLAGKEKLLLESKKWPASFSQRLDITKIQIDAFKPWITRRVTELMGVEDEIVVDYCISQLKFYGEHDAKANSYNAGDGGAEFNEKPYLDPKKFQINLTGFMAKNAKVFVRELWDLLLAAQENEYGIPQAFIDAKKQELEEIKAEAVKIEREIDSIREAEVNANGRPSSRSRGEALDNRRRSSRNRYSRSSSRSRHRSRERSRRDRGEKHVTYNRRATRKRSASYKSYSSSRSSSPSPSRRHRHLPTRTRTRRDSPSLSSSSRSPETSTSRSLSSSASHCTSKSHSHSRENSVVNRDTSYRKSRRHDRDDYKHRKSGRKTSRSRSSSSRRYSQDAKRRRRRRSYSRSVSSSVDAETIHRRKRDK